ncbi:archaellin/type IV pilin N-terminal domain-containing protein [Natrarchaeobaculum sulfurireducens]|nr:archaellin/type IV pilin N-terminal domain-containing protein [Natrarchaeobaculum sulfurireducens]
MRNTHGRHTGTDRGQVGIGTLIVFIAMVLVAAIAAGVLINTAGMLQAQAEATGEESTELVSDRLDTSTAVGIVGDEEDGELEEIRVRVSAAPGANDIPLEETMIQALGPEGQENLAYAPDSDDIFDDPDDIGDLGEGNFVGQNHDKEYIEADDAVLNTQNNEFVLVFDAAAPPFGTENDPFGESQDASLSIVSPSSAVTTVELSAPDLFQKDGEAVRL